MASYAALLRRPEWKIRRAEIIERWQFKCGGCERGGVPLEVHHKRYEYGKKPWEYPDSALIPLCPKCHTEATEEQQQGKMDLRYPKQSVARQELAGVIATFARHMTMRMPAKPKRAEVMDAERVGRFISALIDNDPGGEIRRHLMEFAGWLWKTGTTDTDTILAIIEDRCRRNPENPFSYYAPDGKARNCAEATIAIDFAARQNQARKAEERRCIEQMQEGFEEADQSGEEPEAEEDNIPT